MVTLIRLGEGDHKAKCSHPKCDDQPALWRFPQTRSRKPTYDKQGQRGFYACAEHLSPIADIVNTYHA